MGLNETQIFSWYEVEHAHGRMLQHIRRLQLEHFLQLVHQVDGWLRWVVAVDVNYAVARFQSLFEALLEYFNVVFLKLIVQNFALNSIGEEERVELRHDVDLLVDGVRAQGPEEWIARLVEVIFEVRVVLQIYELLHYVTYITQHLVIVARASYLEVVLVVLEFELVPQMIWQNIIIEEVLLDHVLPDIGKQ